MSNPPLYMIKTLSIEKDVSKNEHEFSSSKNISPPCMCPFHSYLNIRTRFIKNLFLPSLTSTFLWYLIFITNTQIYLEFLSLP